MGLYRVTVSGENFIMELDGERGRYGFRVSQFVEAEDAHAAGDLALGMIRQAPQLQTGTPNDIDDPVTLEVSDVELLHDSTLPAQQPGFAFYPDD